MDSLLEFLRRHVKKLLFALGGFAVTFVGGLLGRFPLYWVLIASAIMAMLLLMTTVVVYAHWPALKERAQATPSKIREALYLLGMVAMLAVIGWLAQRPTPQAFKSQKANLDALGSRMIALSQRTDRLAADSADLRKLSDGRADRDSAKTASLNVIATATLLEREGRALFKQCCEPPSYPPPPALATAISSWRRRVRSFIRSTSNPAFVSELYVNQVDQPRPHTECYSGMTMMNNEMWEIEQDLKELARIRGENH